MPVRSRPTDLPEYDNPPLNEVVLGLQFEPVPGYQQVYVSDVWRLFAEDYPTVQEQLPLQPQFETFGRPRSTPLGLPFISGAMHSRYWFMSKNHENLIQFQNDRFLHNWRKVGNETNSYPRFESMVAEFEGELTKLERYFNSLGSGPLVINQIEVTYINHIDHSDVEAPQKWFRILHIEDDSLESLNLGYRRVLRSDQREPIGRLHVELGNALKGTGKAVYALNLTVRGSPSTQNVEGALEFIRQGRAVIVKEFTKITTESAHQAWKRLQ